MKKLGVLLLLAGGLLLSSNGHNVLNDRVQNLSFEETVLDFSNSNGVSVKKAETNDVSDDVRDIFDELQDDYERDGEYHTGFGGCYGEDDRESEYYNPTHPFDD